MSPMRIAIGSDHRGYTVKARLVQLLTEQGHEVRDAGAADQKTSVDYPDVASAVAKQVSQSDVDRGNR